MEIALLPLRLLHTSNFQAALSGLFPSSVFLTGPCPSWIIAAALRELTVLSLAPSLSLLDFKCLCPELAADDPAITA